MYAKLVVGATAIPAMQAMRDIVRLVTSATPSTALLGGFSTSSSLIVDPTPAGWTYVGSNNASDRPSVAAVGATNYAAADTQCNLAISAPCLEGSALKYAVLNVSWLGAMTTTNVYFCLTGAVSVNASGVCTNEGPRFYAGSIEGVAELATHSLRVAAGDVIHLVANQQGITIINEARGMQAVWEMSMSDVNRFYGTAPFVQYCHSDSSNTSISTISVPTSSTTTRITSPCGAVFAVTDVNTGVFSGTYEPSVLVTMNLGNLYQTMTNIRQNSINAAGSPRYQVSPIWLQNGVLGHPAQSITGVVPVYWTKGSIGTTGDTMYIGGDAYTYFNCGTGYGLAMKTS